MQEKIYHDIKNLNWEQEVAYFNESAKKGSFKDLVNELQSTEVVKFKKENNILHQYLI